VELRPIDAAGPVAVRPEKEAVAHPAGGRVAGRRTCVFCKVCGRVFKFKSAKQVRNCIEGKPITQKRV
jgi:hypothetical protein